MLRRVVIAVVFVGSACSAAVGQDWARKMFETTEYNFGTVARGAKAEYEFVLTNSYLEDVHIASVRSSCGCTTPSIKDPSLLKTYQKGVVVAKVNSDRFLGQKGATITVTIDKPFFAEVQLHVSAYIRSDVVFQPGSVQFGAVDQGKPCQSKVAINYAGRDDWRILDVRSPNPHLSAKVVETGRGSGQVGYDLLVHLDSTTPPGYLHDNLLLVTNDRNMTQVPVPVEARIETGITVSPVSLLMGVLQPGQKVTKQLVIRGKKPFRIISVSCEDANFTFDTSADSAPKALHVIPVTFEAGQDPGKVVKTIRIETDLGDETPELSAYAVVTAP